MKRGPNITKDDSRSIKKDIQKNEDKYNQVNCLTFLYARREEKELRIGSNQIRSNKANNIFMIQDVSDLTIHDVAHEYFRKNFNDKTNEANATLLKRNLLNAFLISSLGIDFEYVKKGEKKMKAKKTFFVKIDIKRYLRDNYMIDYNVMSNKINELIENKIRSKDYIFNVSEIVNVIISSTMGGTIVWLPQGMSVNNGINNGINNRGNSMNNYNNNTNNTSNRVNRINNRGNVNTSNIVVDKKYLIDGNDYRVGYSNLLAAFPSLFGLNDIKNDVKKDDDHVQEINFLKPRNNNSIK